MTIRRKIDPVILSNHREQIAGQVPIRSLTRLNSLLQSSDGDVQVSVMFEPGVNDHPVITGEASANVSVECQRCLKTMSLTLESEFRLIALDLDAEVDQVTGLFDSVLIDHGEIDLFDLIEDELLTAMPLSPMHAASETCQASGNYSKGASVPKESTPKTQRPFEDLGKLIAD